MRLQVLGSPAHVAWELVRGIQLAASAGASPSAWSSWRKVDGIGLEPGQASWIVGVDGSAGAVRLLSAGAASAPRSRVSLSRSAAAGSKRRK